LKTTTDPKFSTATKVLAAILTAVTALVIFLALFFGAGLGTMLLVGALHSAVPVVPAISFVGSLWLVVLGMWFRLIFGTSASKK